jgi:ABC-2 type transport system permease protein
MGISFLVSLLYCVDALYGERRDRSIMFWKSLPVSDTTTVLAKLSIPVLVAPVVAFAITIVVQLEMLLLSGLVLLGTNLSLSAVWDHLSLSRSALVLFFHLVAGHGLWFAPIYGWMLLVSAWARRVPLLWATLPLVGIGAAEKIAFGTSYLAGIFQRRLMAGPEGGGSATGMSMEAMTPFTPAELFSSPGLWLGFAITAALVAAAIRVRRYRGSV